MNLSMKQQQNHRQVNRLVLTKEERGGGRRYWEFGNSRCKMLYTGWIHSKALLYSTGNYIQYPAINHIGKEYGNECILSQLYSSKNFFSKRTYIYI